MSIFNFILDGKQDLLLMNPYICHKCNVNYEEKSLLFEEKVLSEIDIYIIPDIADIIFDFANTKYEHRCKNFLSRLISSIFK